MDGTCCAYLPAALSCAGIQSEERKMAPDVEDVVHHHRDRARGAPQGHRPGAAAFRLARGLCHIAPLLQIPAPHGPVIGKRGRAELGRGPVEHTGEGVRQERCRDPGAQEGYDPQSER